MTENISYVSVLMTTYNSEKYVTETIKSVINQTYKNWEFIIVDDASTDNTYNLISEFCKNDARIKLYKFEQNKGQSYALNFGLKKCAFDLIARIDNDDLMHPDRLQIQVNYMQNYHEVAIVGSYVNYINKNGLVVGKGKTDFLSTTAIKTKIDDNHIIGFNHPTIMMRKNIIMDIGGYRGEYWPADDIDLWNRVIEKGFRIDIMPEYLTFYRIHNDSVSIHSVKNSLLKSKWVKYNLIRRRSGTNEVSFDEFMEYFNGNSIVKKYNSKRKLFGQIFYKKAVFKFSNKEIINFSYNIFLAIILNPTYSIKKIIQKI